MNGEENKSYCFTTTRSFEYFYDYFKVMGYHEWDLDGESYDDEWTESTVQFC